MTAPDGLSRRGVLVKLGILFNGAVGAILAVPIVRYILSPVIRERRPGYESWLSLGPLGQFPEGADASGDLSKPGRESIGWGNCEYSLLGASRATVRSSRSLRSIARISGARFAGFRSRVCSCAHATAASTIPTARAPPDLRSAACLNIATRWSRAIC